MQIKDISGRVLHEVPGDTLKGVNLRGADLCEADLRDANLRSADLRSANLRGAVLHSAALSEANLSRANLSGAYLRRADLRGVALHRVDLSAASLGEADLRGANLRGADLSRAHLGGANIEGAVLPLAITPSKGRFTGYKKVLQADGTYAVIELLIPPDARRTSALSSRKCRASHVVVVKGAGISPTCDKTLTYTPGITVEADSYNPDRREECTHGIHFFMTREEAEAYKP